MKESNKIAYGLAIAGLVLLILGWIGGYLIGKMREEREEK